MLLAIFASCVLVVLGQFVEDQSLKDACLHMNSVYQQRDPPNDQAAVGDTCIMKWNVYTTDEEQAREFCSLYAPWRLNNVVYGDITECHVEATMMCAAGWMQMFGRCFSIVEKKKRFSKNGAIDACQKTYPRSELASLGNRYIIGVWKRIFPNLQQIWVRANPGWEQYAQRLRTAAAGDDIALAFDSDSYYFRVMSNSLVYVNASLELQVLCEYKPPVTRAEINYLSRRYQEITHKAVEVADGVLVRTTSFYQSDTANPKVCEKVLKPYLNNEMIGEFLPNDERMRAFDEAKPKSLSFALAHGHSKYNKDMMRSHEQCRGLNDKYKVPVTGVAYELPIPPSRVCDNMRSTVVSHFRSTTYVEVAADSLRAPVWCQLGKRVQYRYDVPNGWEKFERDNGLVVAHRLFRDAKTWYEAQQSCKDEGALLSGFDNHREADFLIGHLKAAQYPLLTAWIGLFRKQACWDIKEHEVPLNRPCSKINVMEWVDNVAQNKVDENMWGVSDDLYTNNPSYGGMTQKCGSIFHDVPGWLVGNNPKGNLDDNWCTAKLYYFCMKYVNGIVQGR